MVSMHLFLDSNGCFWLAALIEAVGLVSAAKRLLPETSCLAHRIIGILIN